MCMRERETERQRWWGEEWREETEKNVTVEV